MEAFLQGPNGCTLFYITDDFTDFRTYIASRSEQSVSVIVRISWQPVGVYVY